MLLPKPAVYAAATPKNQTAMQTRNYSIMAMPCPIFRESRLLKILFLVAFLQALLLCFLRVSGQSKGEGTPNPADYAYVKPLSVGDTMLPIELHTTWPTPRKLLLPEGAAGKLTIFYFWHTTCHGCWAKLPKLQALVDSFDGAVEIIPVSNEPGQKIKNFIDRKPELKTLLLPHITADTLLSAMFPYTYVSHVVWILADGRVGAITAPDYLIASNIETALSGKIPGWRIKRDKARLNRNEPLLAWNNATDYKPGPGYQQYFVWTAYMDGLVPGYSEKPYGKGIRRTFINTRLLTFYRFANHNLPHCDYQYIVPDAIRDKFFKPDTEYQNEWLAKTGWSFEMADPEPTDIARVMEQINAQLQCKFPYSLQMDSLPMNTLFIKDNGKYPKTEGILLNHHIAQLNHHSGFPFDIAADIKIWVDELPDGAALKDITLFEKWLGKQGLTYEQNPKTYPVCIIHSKIKPL